MRVLSWWGGPASPCGRGAYELVLGEVIDTDPDSGGRPRAGLQFHDLLRGDPCSVHSDGPALACRRRLPRQAWASGGIGFAGQLPSFSADVAVAGR